MFETDLDQSKEEIQPPDYTGLKIVLLLVPVFFFFAYFDKADLGLAVTVILGMILLAVKLRWHLRKHVWFWVTIAVIVALHVPLFLIAPWPANYVRAVSFPFGIADFLVMLGTLRLAERLFSKGQSTG